jgi:hypothetical protein
MTSLQHSLELGGGMTHLPPAVNDSYGWCSRTYSYCAIQLPPQVSSFAMTTTCSYQKHASVHNFNGIGCGVVRTGPMLGQRSRKSHVPGLHVSNCNSAHVTCSAKCCLYPRHAGTTMANGSTPPQRSATCCKPWLRRWRSCGSVGVTHCAKLKHTAPLAGTMSINHTNCSGRYFGRHAEVKLRSERVTTTANCDGVYKCCSQVRFFDVLDTTPPYAWTG